MDAETRQRIAEIDAECRELYRRGGKYLTAYGKPTTGYAIPGPNHYGPGPRTVKTNAEGWAYIKGRYAELKRERERLVAAAAR